MSLKPCPLAEDTSWHDYVLMSHEGTTPGEAHGGLSPRDEVAQWPLNDAQREAVTCTEGPLRVIAGPGSGKTRVLAYRIAYILQRRLASPRGVFAVTFTRKAAEEIRGRVSDLLCRSDIDAEDISISTFHSLAHGIVRAEARELGFDPAQLRICRPAQARRLLRQAMREGGLDRRWEVDLAARAIERAKERLVAPDEFVRIPGDRVEEGLAHVYRRYQALLKQSQLVDYADVIYLAARLLDDAGGEDAPPPGDFYAELCRYLLVDEFQDTSYAQYRLMRALASRRRNVCVIGDPLQSIYRGWRGADPEQLLRQFDADYPDARAVTLTETHRSTGTILAAADAVVRALGLPPRDLRTGQGAGEPVALLRADTDRDEALRIAREVGRLADGSR